MTTTEIDVARQITTGAIGSPAMCGNIFLATLRISGTGVAWRSSHKEFTFRDPNVWLGTEMQRRCAGLPVCVGHPDGGLLSAESFARTVIGIMMMAYVHENGNELWGVARFFDREIASAVARVDTSPAVAFAPGETTAITLGDGETLLVEGTPHLLDHVALVETGVWTRKPEIPNLKPS